MSLAQRAAVMKSQQENGTSFSSEMETGGFACYIKSRADWLTSCMSGWNFYPLCCLFLLFFWPAQNHNTLLLFQFPKSALTLLSERLTGAMITLPPHFKSGHFIDAILTKKLLPQAFPSLMGKLNLTTGGTTEVSSIPWQFTLSLMWFRISRLLLYPV